MFGSGVYTCDLFSERCILSIGASYLYCKRGQIGRFSCPFSVCCVLIPSIEIPSIELPIRE